MLLQSVSKSATKLAYNKKSVHKGDIPTKNNWNFELRVGKGTDVLSYDIVSFVQKDLFHQKTEHKDTFYQPSVTITRCTESTEKFQNVRIGFDCKHDIFFEHWMKFFPVLDV